MYVYSSQEFNKVVGARHLGIRLACASGALETESEKFIFLRKINFRPLVLDEIDLRENNVPLLSTSIALQDARKQLPLLCPAALSDRNAHSDMALLGLLGSLGPF